VEGSKLCHLELQVVLKLSLGCCKTNPRYFQASLISFDDFESEFFGYCPSIRFVTSLWPLHQQRANATCGAWHIWEKNSPKWGRIKIGVFYTCSPKALAARCIRWCLWSSPSLLLRSLDVVGHSKRRCCLILVDLDYVKLPRMERKREVNKVSNLRHVEEGVSWKNIMYKYTPGELVMFQP